MSHRANEYFICLSWGGEPIPWNIWSDNERHAPTYFTRTLRTMERHLSVQGLTFYLTWRVDDLPSRGSDVVAIVLGDEWCLTPEYASSTLATFKCYGTALQSGWSAPRRLLFNTSVALKRLRTEAYRCIYHLRNSVTTGGRRETNIIDIPLGYGNLLDLPRKDIASRSTDVFFAGSIEHSDASKRWPRRWLRNPKSLSRENMLVALQDLRRKHPAWNIDVHTSSRFVLNELHKSDPAQEHLDAESYSRRLMDSKVCLVPRGTSLETFRYFEALRYGCIPVTEYLPDRWFYNGSPRVTVRDWSQLESKIAPLLTDIDAMRDMHRRSVDWWEEHCSEDALGAFMAQEIAARLADAPRKADRRPAEHHT